MTNLLPRPGRADFITHGLGADCPIPVVDDWHQAAALIRELHTDRTKLDRLQLDVMRWWQAYQASLQGKMKAAFNRWMPAIPSAV